MKESNFPEELEQLEASGNNNELILEETPPVQELPDESAQADSFEAEAETDIAGDEFLNLSEAEVITSSFEDDFLTEIDAQASEEAIIDSSVPANDPTQELSMEQVYALAGVLQEELTDPETREELMAADHAMYSAGLQHPEDTQFLFDETQDTQLPDAEPEDPIPVPVAPQSKPSQKPSHPARPVRKGRPKRKKGSGLMGIPHLFAALIWLLIIVAIGVTLGRMLWVCAADVLAFGREERIVTISVTTEDTMESIAQKLQDAGLIRYTELFLLYADLTDAQEDITTGTFTLNTVYDYHALVNQMSPRSGNRAVVEDVLIPEGYNCRQIFALLEEKGICKAADLEAWAAEGELSDYWFLEGVERGHKYCLEGFLFPDTYDFYENSTPKAALERLLDGFEYRFSEELKAQIPALNETLTEMMRQGGKTEEFIAANQFDVRDIINVASLIEKETASNSESPKIASVIYNRLFDWGSNPSFLNIDATIIYALGGKTDLTAEDMAVDSPYNTYTNIGLTPGPIANPGLDSIKAAMDPESTSYYYYVLDPAKGSHVFSKTLAEHEKNIQKIYGE